MDKSSALVAVTRFRESLERRGVRVSKLILFGSFARGDSRDGSDIDLVVISEDFAGQDHWKRVDLLSEAIYEVFAPLEAVSMTAQEWDAGDSVIVDYARSGEVVYVA